MSQPSASAAPSVVAVTGASGQVGGRVARRLAASGLATRLVGRDPARLPELPGAVRADPAEYGDGEAMRRALDGADTLFLVSARESADRVREHRSAVDAAVAAGVRRIVYLSFLGAAPGATFTFARDHWHTERHIAGVPGLSYTFLRDSFYLAALPAMAGRDGVIRGPAGNGRVSAVAHDDIADVAAEVLLGTSHDGLSYDVTGREAIGLADAAEALSRVTGRTVRYLPETREEAYASRDGYGAADWEVTGWVTSYEAIATGELSTIADTVRRLTGHEPVTLAEYLEHHPEAYAHLM
ncbi:NAD(P)H-binding protein [Streptomyces sp. LP05-1]|uniref:NAD(P)H-binding protein n=1 Tax=Streptomyces pyxinae TaxID=2970734 RepID=A0ABT2CHZ9_9ACTN|nr:NAD(P)H-binding protein [Streptomyces sp. LP05-1]MCS0636722.1 NAD(P)H-binding protein [Streptomyces sp. LP05-1]